VRPRHVVVVTGTGTEVGKTWASARLIARLRGGGLAVAARKPAQSFEAGDEVTDAHVLAEASGETPEQVCPRHRWYPVPMAPPMAAEALGLEPPALGDLVGETEQSWPAVQVDVGIVEGAGGVASPQASDGDTAALARSLHAERAVLVAGAGLGTINLVRLCVAALAPTPAVVFLNRYDADDRLQRANRAWLETGDGLDVVVDVGELALSLSLPGTKGR
jgi:dethiobiotin synthetase